MMMRLISDEPQTSYIDLRANIYGQFALTSVYSDSFLLSLPYGSYGKESNVFGQKLSDCIVRKLMLSSTHCPLFLVVYLVPVLMGNFLTFKSQSVSIFLHSSVVIMDDH